MERHTSWKVVMAYLFVVVFCFAMFYFLQDLRNSIENQRTNINSQNVTLEWASSYTEKVHKAQNTANLIAFSNQPQLISQFAKQRDELHAIADSIFLTDIDKQNKQRIKEIANLIERKGKISYILSKQFYDFNPFADFDRTIDDYQPIEREQPTIVTTTTKDTIVHQKKNLNFWQRLGNVFSPENDSIVQISTIKHDTLIQHETDSLPILDDLKSLSDKAKSEYQNKIKQYQRQAGQLIADDNQLSEEISSMLLQFNQEVLDSTVAEITKSEALIKENSKISSIIGFATLVLIIIFIILIICDVNKIAKMRKAAENAKRKTEEVLESRHKLLLSVSHDIKTPLTSILGNTELMDKNVNEKEVTSIKQSADHILSLLTNLLEFSSLEQGKLKAENAPFDVSVLCNEIGTMFEPIARQKNLEFRVSSDIKEGCFVISDKLKIKQIISNLISNAIKYTLEGKVEFLASIDHDTLAINISDTGLGIPQDKIEEVFKPFARIDTYNQFAEGSGYGLSVVKGLVELLNGEIKLESEVGKGSHYTIRIPVGTHIADTDAADSATTLNCPPLKILIIDDDNTLLSVVEGLLDKLGHTGIPCSSKNDIEAALSKASSYDYILTDREMGALSGNEILHLFKEADACKPVILMTARVEYDIDKAKDEGFDGFIRKPFNMDDLEDLFGRIAVSESPSHRSPFMGLFPAFCEMMGNDSEAIRSILEVFSTSTANDLLTMNTCIDNNDFVGAQALCHKMLPMFTQLGHDITFLSKMNTLRGLSSPAESYPNWTFDAAAFMTTADELLESIDEMLSD